MLKRLVLNNFENVIRCAQLGNNLKNDLMFHNQIRLRCNKKGKSTYMGKGCCGVMCFMLGNILRNYNIPVKMYISEKKYGKYTKDHVFLKFDNIIIDPTYRQFLTDNRKFGNSNYNNYLYNTLSPFYVGHFDNLYALKKNLIELNKSEFDVCHIDNDVLNNWKEMREITHALDKFDILYNKKKVIELLKI